MHQSAKSIALLLSLLAGTASAQTFNSGSNGSFGPITLAANENRVIDLPADGIIHATTVTLGANSRLAFRPNARNTPVYLLATGDIRMEGNSRISVRPGCAGTDGIFPGGPGGFSGGRAGVGDLLPGHGQGPGGGAPGVGGSHRTGPNGVSSPTAYGSGLLMPLVGGSGGGASVSGAGGGGGGAILVATSGVLEITGSSSIFADADTPEQVNGAACTVSSLTRGGSGAIRLMATTLRVNQPLSLFVGGFNSGFGWCRVDALNRGPSTAISCNGHADFPVRSLMQVFPPGNPRLDVTSVAGTSVPLDGGPVAVTLPSTAPAAQPVTIRAEGFTGTVPIRLRLTPEHGNPVTVDGEIVMSGATGTVTLTPSFPPNVKTFVQVWTR